MKKKALILILLMAILSVKAVAQNEVNAMWQEIYGILSTDEQRISVMLKIMESKDAQGAEFLLSSLNAVLFRNIATGSPSEQAGKTQLARLITQELGNLKHEAASDVIYSIYRETKNIYLKADSAEALGKMRAVKYASTLANDLRALNNTPSITEKREQEIVALALVRGLNEMRAMDGYESVFFASLSWYSSFSNVRQTAREALLTMVDDPTQKNLEILENNPETAIKIAALEAALMSKATDEKKKEIASRSLTIGLERPTPDAAAAAVAAQLRIVALTALAGLGDTNPDTVPLLARIVGNDKKNDTTLDETVKAYLALGINGSDPAAKFLESKLIEYNNLEKKKANSTRDKLLIKQLLSSMMTSKNPLLRNVLLQAQFIDHDSGIQRQIKETLDSLPK